MKEYPLVAKQRLLEGEVTGLWLVGHLARKKLSWDLEFQQEPEAALDHYIWCPQRATMG